MADSFNDVRWLFSRSVLAHPLTHYTKVHQSPSSTPSTTSKTKNPSSRYTVKNQPSTTSSKNLIPLIPYVCHPFLPSFPSSSLPFPPLPLPNAPFLPTNACPTPELRRPSHQRFGRPRPQERSQRICSDGVGQNRHYRSGISVVNGR